MYKRSNDRGCLFWLVLAVGLGFGLLICLVTIVAAGALAYGTTVETNTAVYSEPLDDVESAEIELGIGVGELIVRAGTNADDLFDADVTYAGEIVYDVSAGDTHKAIRLTQRGSVSSPGSWGVFGINLDFLNRSSPQLVWRIDLNRDIPLRLDISGGVGGVELDLTDLQLEDLHVEVGVGGGHIRLPEAQTSYDVRLSGGVGSTEITLPRDAAVRIEASVGVGGITMPDHLNRVSGNGEFVGSSGVWESANFADAETRITITFEGGVGGLTVR